MLHCAHNPPQAKRHEFPKFAASSTLMPSSNDGGVRLAIHSALPDQRDPACLRIASCCSISTFRFP